MLNALLLFFASYIFIFWWGFARGRRRGKREAYSEMAKSEKEFMDSLEDTLGDLGPLEDE